MRHAELRKFPLPPARVRQFSALRLSVFALPLDGGGRGWRPSLSRRQSCITRVHRAFPRAKLAR